MFACILSISCLLFLGFFGAPLPLWTLFLAAMLLFTGASIFYWVIFITLALIFNISSIRKKFISSAVMKLMKSVMPNISETERTALEAGVVWIEGELFSGKPNFEKMKKEPAPKLSAEEQAFLDGPVEKVCELTNDWEIWQNKEIPKEIWDYLKKEKFFGMIIPKEWGGLGFSAYANSAVIKKLASRSVPVCITVMVPNSLGPAELLIHYGTDAQKKRYLQKLAIGEEMPCFALTEPGAGSDAGGIQASGEVFKNADGKLCIRLNWEKRWITLASVSTVLGLAFKMYDPQNLLGKGTDLGITCALIPSNTLGVTLGLIHDPMGVPFINCPTFGKDVEVSLEQSIVGGIDGVGKGWEMLMECLGAGRGISLPAQATGGTVLTALVSSAHASIRKQFGMSIGKFEGIEEPLARIAANAYTLEAMRRLTCSALNQGIKPSVVTAIAKYQSTEIMRKSINDGMDILGGAGITCGPRNTLAHAYISLPIGITVEGANILTRTLMIFGQGALRAHPFAFKELNAIEKNDLNSFDVSFWGHTSHIIQNLSRSILLSITRAHFAKAPITGPTARYYQKLSWASASFAIMTDISMGLLGGKLKQKEQLTGRFADILSWMYMGYAVLRRFEEDGCKGEDLPYVNYSMEMAFSNMQNAFNGIFSNISAPGLSWIFRIVRAWSSLNQFTKEPEDQLTHDVAKLIQTPGEQRNRIIAGIYLPKDSSQAVARLEATMRIVKQAEEIDQKIRTAIREKKIPKIKGSALYTEALKGKIITQTEFENLQNAEKMRWDAIQVDYFAAPGL